MDIQDIQAQAEVGDAEAQYRYGRLLRQGRLDEDNGPEKAVSWLQKAAAQGRNRNRRDVEVDE